MLQRAWHLPLRKLVLAMPITAVIVALATKVAHRPRRGRRRSSSARCCRPPTRCCPRAWSPTRACRAIIRHSLNLESGLNDGLALPAVLALVAALAADSDFVWWTFVLQDVSVGVAFGLVIGYLASLVLPRGRDLDRAMPAHQRALYALGVAFLTYGVTTLPPHGNGVIAVFVCAIILGIRRPDVRRVLRARPSDIIEIVKLGVFVVFGSLLTLDGLFGDGWAAVAIVVVTLLVARPVAVWIALAGTGVDGAEKAFMAWFGPKGVATMTFSLLVLGQAIPQGERIFNLAALVVVVLGHRPRPDRHARRGVDRAPRRARASARRARAAGGVA